MYNLWIYQRRSACSTRLQHGGSSACVPLQGVESAVAWGRARVMAGAEQGAANNVLPFRALRESAVRDTPGAGDRKRRGRPTGRGNGSGAAKRD